MLANAAAGRVRAEPRGTGARARRWFVVVGGTCCGTLVAAITWLALPGSPSVVASTNPDVRVPGLLVAGDGGTGWTSTAAGALQAEPAGCFRPRADLISSSARSVVAVLITAPAGIPTVDEVAARYANTGRAAAAFDSVAASLRGCATFATAAGIATVTPIRIPVDGTRSAAARVALGAGAERAGADFVAVQRGSAVAVVVYATAGTPDRSAVASVTARAYDRLGP